MISLNIITVIIHLIFFLVVVALLNRLLLQPLLRVMDERERRVEGNRRQAEVAASRAEELKAEYKSQLEEARRDAQKERESIRLQGVAEEDRIIKAAREKAGDMIAELRERIAVEYRQAQDSLRAEAEVLGRQIATKILGRPV